MSFHLKNQVYPIQSRKNQNLIRTRKNYIQRSAKSIRSNQNEQKMINPTSFNSFGSWSGKHF